MQLSRTGQHALGTVVAVALLAGCSGTGESQSSTPTSDPVSGSTGTITGSTPLLNSNGGACDVDQATISPFGKFFAGGCTAGSPSTADRWAYPAGGTPTNYSTNVEEPIGTAISNK